MNFFKVAGLFGYVDHEIHFRAESPTILTAPNGAGKTHVLQLIRSALSLDVSALAVVPFELARLELNDGNALEIRRTVNEEAERLLTFSVFEGKKEVEHTRAIRVDELESNSNDLPDYLRSFGDGTWIDLRTDRILEARTLERRYGVRLSGRSSELFARYPRVQTFWTGANPILIDTKRLDASAINPRTSRDPIRTSEGTLGASRIQEYTRQLRSQVAAARRDSVHATQSADLSFAARALASASASINEAKLHERYDEILSRYEALARNSLATGDAPIPFPQSTTPTVRRILNVFLDDWEKRLQPLLPLNQKIETLRRILDSKLRLSGKRTAMSGDGQLTFRTASEHRVPVARLSSGEQHLVALFTSLLFSTGVGSLVLIDEPEISLHAAWKHAFLEDISLVAALADLQIVLATHSSAIVQGRWDLTEELRFPEFAGESESEDGDDEGYVDGEEIL